jgi:hypothetical protein
VIRWSAGGGAEIPFSGLIGAEAGAASATYPRSLAERAFADLRHWSTPDRGGHFMAHEEPRQVAGELRAFFGKLRRSEA